MTYEAIKVDETTWMVKRYGEHDTESLLRNQPPEATAEQMIAAAVERGSWA
jgi:hypothetical protein